MLKLNRAHLANTLRVLSMDAVQRANSGHPGMPMGMADIAEVLWRDFMCFNPKNPNWVNRDRFVLSNGHGAILLYSLLHLTGFDISIEDIKKFRQLGSNTPGHPEYGHTPGVDATTGPLGQGIAMGVGMAIAEKLLAKEFNKGELDIINHYTYIFSGDGCLMEGISHEACSLAGTLGLNKLIMFYDNNGISIDEAVSGWFTEDIKTRFLSYNWNVIDKVDGHDHEEIKNSIIRAKNQTEKPSLIICDTKIGFGSPNKSNTSSCHGSPLGEEEIILTRKNLSWNYPAFFVPKEIYSAWDKKEDGLKQEKIWNEKFVKYEAKYPEQAREFNRRIQEKVPKICDSTLNDLFIKTKNIKSISTRECSGICIEKLNNNLPELLGGSADLAESNCTLVSTSKIISKEKFNGNYIRYGVREFAMSAIMNGISLHKGFVPYGGTFLVFSDYARSAIRMSALMKNRVIYVLTHDSIGLGEDGPTHQPIEHISTLRAIPNLQVWRPCNFPETLSSWLESIDYNGPTAIILSRQKLLNNVNPEIKEHMDKIKMGGYTILERQNTQGVFVATGSEVEIAIKASEILKKEGIQTNVVSMPCCELFKKQSQKYQNSILLKDQPRVIIEAGIPDYWHQFRGEFGTIIGINDYGQSASAKDLFNIFGFTVKNAVDIMKKSISKKNKNDI